MVYNALHRSNLAEAIADIQFTKPNLSYHANDNPVESNEVSHETSQRQ